MDEVPAISLRENERGMQIGAGWNPHWHQPTDLYSSYSDNDFRLGLNANGDWSERHYTGTGFPTDFMIRYHLYRLHFPLLALGRLRERLSR